MREWLSGGAPPCQGGGRGFDSRLALLLCEKRIPSVSSFCIIKARDDPEKSDLAGAICAFLRAVQGCTELAARSLLTGRHVRVQTYSATARQSEKSHSLATSPTRSFKPPLRSGPRNADVPRTSCAVSRFFARRSREEQPRGYDLRVSTSGARMHRIGCQELAHGQTCSSADL